MNYFPQEKFRASWGSLINLSTGNLVIDDDTITLQPNIAQTVVSGGMSRKAYKPQIFNIADVCGYSSVFAAWMAIHLTDGTKIKVSIAISKKRNKNLSML